MSNLEIIETLCALVEHQADVIRYLSLHLAESRNLTDEEQRMIASAKDEYTALLCADEIPYAD